MLEGRGKIEVSGGGYQMHRGTMEVFGRFAGGVVRPARVLGIWMLRSKVGSGEGQ